jgi:DNA-binding MarR family transcriptional regulator
MISKTILQVLGGSRKFKTHLSLLTQIEAMTLPTKRGDAPGPTLQQLASQMSLRVSGITHALAPLVRDGLVELIQDSLDARMKHALLTSKGRARLGKAVEHWAVANRHVEKVMGSAKTAKLREGSDILGDVRSVRRA